MFANLTGGASNNTTAPTGGEPVKSGSTLDTIMSNLGSVLVGAGALAAAMQSGQTPNLGGQTNANATTQNTPAATGTSPWIWIWVGLAVVVIGVVVALVFKKK